jgi:hypothetical protein
MPDTKISGLPPDSALLGNEVVPLVQSGSTVQATVAQIAAFQRAGATLIPTSPLTANAGANVAAINAALAKGGSWYIKGTVPINASLLNGGLFGAWLFGDGWGSTIRQSLGGTVLYWVGAAGLPMYVHQPDFGGGVSGILFKGNSASPPLCAILLDTGTYSTATNSYSNPSENRNCTEGVFDDIWIGQSIGLDSDASNSQFTNGIIFSGTINGDTHKFGMVMIYAVIGTGVISQNPNASGVSFDTLLVKNSTNCIDLISNMLIRNFYCTSTDYNIILRDTGALSIDSFYTENGGGIFKFLAGTLAGYNNNYKQSLWIRNGGFQMLPSGNLPLIGDVTTSTEWSITFEDFDFQAPFVSPQIPIINLTNPDGKVYGLFQGNIKSTTFNLSLASNFTTGAAAKQNNFFTYKVGDNTPPTQSPGFINSYGYLQNSSTLAALQLVTADIYGGESDTHVLSLTGNIIAASAATLPSVTSLLTAIPNPVVGQTFRLRVINKGGTGSGIWTINGTYGGSFLNLTGGGSPTWDTSTQKYGTAALLTGYGSSAAFPNWPGSAGTIQALVKKSSVPSANGYVVSFDNGTIVTSQIVILTSGFVNIGYMSGGVQFSYADTLNICDGSWHLLEMVLSSPGALLFIDGNLRINVSAHVADAIQGPNFAIGARARVLTSPWQGEIDEVSIWNTALHTASYTPPSSAWFGTEVGLAELYHLDSNFTSSVVASGGGWTINGGPNVGVGAYRDFIVTLTSLGASPTATLQAIDGQ